MIADITTWFPAAVGGTALVGGTLAALAAIRKVPAERTSILVDAAQDVVLIQKQGLDQMRAQLADAHSRISRLEAHIQELERAILRIETLEAENARLIVENQRMVGIIKSFENRTSS